MSPEYRARIKRLHELRLEQPRVRQCLDLLLHYPDDPLFCQFCRGRGEDPAALGESTLLRRAMQFCGTDLQEMRGALGQVYRDISK